MRNPAQVWKVLRRLGAAAVMAGTALAAAQPSPPVSAAAEVFVQTGNTLMATMVRFSPDGQRVATCDGSGLVMGWDATSGRQYRELYKHTGMCLGLAFTPDGQAVLSSGGARSGNDVVMSRWVDGEVLQAWSGHKGQVLDLAATRDGKGAWSLGDQEVMLRWALGSDKPVQTVPLLAAGESAAGTLYTSAMVLSRDQQKAYVARRDGSVLAMNLAGGAPPTVLARLPESISAIALSPDGAVLALSFGTLMGSTSKDVVLLDAATGREIRRLSGHEGNVFALAFSPDGQLLASAAQIDTKIMISGSMKSVSQHEALRVWRLPDGAVLADVRNQRNLNGVPFLRGSLDFSPPASRAPGTSGPGQRLALAMWDEAARVYELDAAQVPRLVHTLEGRGLAPRQLQASDKLGQLLVTDGRPRVEPKDVYLQAAQLRSEFGTPADWTPERVQRTDLLYGPRGMRSRVNRASIWNLKSGRLEQVADWQRATPGDVGLDAQGRFVSIAPLFPNTILFQPLRTYLLRQATLDGQGELKLEHFGYEPWDGPLGALFTTPVAATSTATPTASRIASSTASTTAGVTATAPALTAGSYRTDIMVQSTGQRFTAVAGIPIGDSKNPGAPLPPPRVLVQERLASGERVPRLDIPVPGLVTAMAISADQATLWMSGTASGVAYDMEHKGWLMAVALADGHVLQRWPLAEGITVDVIVAHPDGQMAITNGGTNLSIWDSRQAQRKYFIKASDSLRVVRALAMTADGKRIAAADAAGWTVMWDWPVDGPPVPQWSRTLPAPGAHVLTFLDSGRRLAAGAPDGSVRLLAGKDGEEIARMIRFDTGEWITITPEGYFVASTDGDRWVNVRMNDSVYGIDQFYDVFYRPDLVQRKLAGEDILPFIRVTLQDALRDPPPSVSVKLPAGAVPTAGQKYRVSLEALAQGGGVGEVRVMHNGKLVEVFNRAVVVSGLARAPSGTSSTATGVRAVSAEQAEKALSRGLVGITKAEQDAIQARPLIKQVAGEVEVELAAGENEFSVIGFNGPGNLNARPVSQAVVAVGSAPAPRVFVLAVGVDRFVNANMAPTLQFAVKDATDFASAIREKLGGQYRGAPVVVKTLANEEATHAGLDAALAQLQKEVRTNDLLVWFVASHGTLDNNERYGIVLHDWDGQDLESSLFSTASILEASRRIKAFNQLLILDTCHAGGVSKLVSGLYDARLSVLARNMGLHVFASASATEEAMDGYNGNGLFTHNLLLGLKTAAADANADKTITVNELGVYARAETMRVARLLRKRQEPLLMNFGKDVTVYELH